MMIGLLTLALSALMVQQASATGVIYTRWGRTTCGPTSVLLYTGYVAGSFYSHKGAGSNYVCAHNKPQWGRGNTAGDQPYTSSLFGAEYEIDSTYPKNHPFSTDNNGGASLHNLDPVCAVCYNPTAGATHMVVARQDCPSPDMTLEYSGYLVSEKSDRTGDAYIYYRSEYICVDETPEGRPGSEPNMDGALLFPVQAACGSLPCPPYINLNEITCAVCSI